MRRCLLAGSSSRIATGLYAAWGCAASRWISMAPASPAPKMHINANGRTAAVVAIPGDAMVNVPGVGTKPLWYAFKVGGRPCWS